MHMYLLIFVLEELCLFLKRVMFVVVLMILGQLQQYLSLQRSLNKCLLLQRLINKLSNYVSMHELQFQFTKSRGYIKVLSVFKTVFKIVFKAVYYKYCFCYSLI